MATIIYHKDVNGETVKSMCKASELQGKLAQGFTVDPGELDVKTPETIDWDGVSNDEIRDIAKSAGIEGYETARIKTLKEALEEQV